MGLSFGRWRHGLGCLANRTSYSVQCNYSADSVDLQCVSDREKHFYAPNGRGAAGVFDETVFVRALAVRTDCFIFLLTAQPHRDFYI